MTKKKTETKSAPKTSHHRTKADAVRPICGPHRRLDEALRFAIASSHIRRQTLDIMALRGYADALRRTRCAEHSANALAAYSITETGGRSMFRQTAYESAVAMTLARMVDQGKTAEEAQTLVSEAIRKRKGVIKELLREQSLTTTEELGRRLQARLDKQTIVPVCIGSDDPLTFDTNLPAEYQLVSDALQYRPQPGVSETRERAITGGLETLNRG